VLAMVEKSKTLSELAGEINVTLVKIGRASWRREFNSKLWACNRDRAFSLIREYRRVLADIMDNGISERALSNISRLRYQ
jgi:hypothetical protein